MATFLLDIFSVLLVIFLLVMRSVLLVTPVLLLWVVVFFKDLPLGPLLALAVVLPVIPLPIVLCGATAPFDFVRLILLTDAVFFCSSFF